jgi:hypothetical protein
METGLDLRLPFIDDSGSISIALVNGRSVRFRESSIFAARSKGH